MASSLSGLFRTLTWNDFTRRQANPPATGQATTAAFTSSPFSNSAFSVQPIRGSSPAWFQLQDSFSIKVDFGRDSFVMSWVFSRPQQFQTDLLNHEQGHYNITALVCRDCFVDVMLLKNQFFATAKAGVDAVELIKQQSLSKIATVQKLCDKEVHPEQDAGKSRGPMQSTWDRILQSTFSEARSSGTAAPNGTPHKRRLIDLLNQNEKRI